MKPLQLNSFPVFKATTSRKAPLGNFSNMVVNALRDLKHPNGCSMDKIKKYITENFNLKGKSVSEKISMAIRKGVTFGAIKKSNGHYKLDSMMAVAARRRGKVAVPKKAKRKPKTKSYVKKKIAVRNV